MSRIYLGTDVLETAIQRMEALYSAGHRVVLSFSAGKDSGACLEVCLIAAARTGRLPVEVMMRDEEIMYPGTYEYAERVAARPEVQFHWIIAGQPVVNVFNRKAPYFWVFDSLLKPEEWVRTPPAIAERIKDLNISSIVVPSRFPPAKGHELIDVVGLRGQESRRRMMGLHSSKGYITGKNEHGVRCARPIYDWTDGDVWKAHADLKWDYNRAYDTMHRLGVPRRSLRIAPPTLNSASVRHLKVAAQAWPRWFDKVCQRLPGVRMAANFGLRAVTAHRREGETWREVYDRECLNGPADWIRDRSRDLMTRLLERHKRHSTQEYPDVEACWHCDSGLGSWEVITRAMYGGDPFSLKTQNFLDYVEPEFFRPGAGTWGGKPTW